MKPPTIKHPTERPNFTVVTLDDGGDHELWIAFSYETCVGFMRPMWTDWVVQQNRWGPTTGKHINTLNPDHQDRWNKEEFEWMLSGLLGEETQA